MLYHVRVKLSSPVLEPCLVRMSNGRFTLPKTPRPATCCGTRSRDSCRLTLYTSWRPATMVPTRCGGKNKNAKWECRPEEGSSWHGEHVVPALHFYGSWACNPVAGRRSWAVLNLCVLVAATPCEQVPRLSSVVGCCVWQSSEPCSLGVCFHSLELNSV